jgi:hypothetical protein
MKKNESLTTFGNKKQDTGAFGNEGSAADWGAADWDADEPLASSKRHTSKN